MIRQDQFNKKALPLVKELTACFLAVHADKDKFNAIKATTKQPANPTPDNLVVRDAFFEKAGFTFSEISGYLLSIHGSTNITETQHVFNLLISKNIIALGNQVLNDIHNLNPDFGLSSGNRYKITEEGLFLALHGLTENSILGFPHIIEKYKRAIVQVLGKTKSGDDVIGTGFLIRSEYQYKIITCKHNIEEISNLKFISGDTTLQYSNIKRGNDIDCAVIDVISSELDIEPLPMFLYVDVLSEIVTMGYPTIPRSGDAYLMVHKGEVNGLVKDYSQKNEFIIFSAKTSSGNSGSPLLNKDGAVVGMVTNEFFDQEAYINKGKPPYYAAMPSDAIMSHFGLNLIENIFDSDLLIKLLETVQQAKAKS
jgi:hypothetical protein